MIFLYNKIGYLFEEERKVRIRHIVGIAAVLMTALLVFIAGCNAGGPQSSVGQKEKQDFVNLYFANKDGTDLVEEKLDVKNVAYEELPEYVVNKLLEGPKAQENTRAIRAGTSLLSLEVDKGGATVDLSKEFYNTEGIQDVLAASSIVKSLCSIHGIERVKVLVEGEELTGQDGKKSGAVKDNDLIFDADALNQDEANVTLYFSDADAMYLVPEIRRIKVPKGESMEKMIVTELIRGPKKEKLYKTVPAETKIRSVETKDGVCFVNLSNEFITKHGGGSAGEQMTVYSIVNSLTELSNVDKVQFLIEGEKKDVFIHLIFNEPIERDVSMISKS